MPIAIPNCMEYSHQVRYEDTHYHFMAEVKQGSFHKESGWEIQLRTIYKPL